MRKYLAGFIVAALAVGLVGTAIGGPTPITQTISGPKLKPTKLNKKKEKDASLTVRVKLVGTAAGGPIPQKATLVNIDIGKNIKINAKATDKCTESLAGSTRSVALATCGDAQVSIDGSVISPGRAGAASVHEATKGSFASAALPLGPGGTAVLFPVDVIAFNGGKKVLTLWTRIGPLATTTILPGALSGAPGKKFGKRLAVTVPPLAGGAGALDDFQAQLKNGSYITANCKSNKKKTQVKGGFTYAVAPAVTVKSNSKVKKCNQKK